MVLVSEKNEWFSQLKNKFVELDKNIPSMVFQLLKGSIQQLSATYLYHSLQGADLSVDILDVGRIGYTGKNLNTKAKIKRFSAAGLRRRIQKYPLSVLYSNNVTPSPQSIPTFYDADFLAATLSHILEVKHCCFYMDEEMFNSVFKLTSQKDSGRVEYSYTELIETVHRDQDSFPSVELLQYGKSQGLEFHIHDTHSGKRLITIKNRKDIKTDLQVMIELSRPYARFRLRFETHQKANHSKIFSKLGTSQIEISHLRVAPIDGEWELSFFVDKSDLEDVNMILEYNQDNFGFTQIDLEKDIAIVELIGHSLDRSAWVLSRAIDTLKHQAIEFEFVEMTEVKISLLLASDQATKAIRKLNEEFI